MSAQQESAGQGKTRSSSSTQLLPLALNMPTSLLLYWQSAPLNFIFVAFQADCAARGLAWHLTKAQQLALEWFVRHPISKHYPPRASSLRSLLKRYITRIEEPGIMERRLAGEDADHDPVMLELMEAYIALSVAEKEKSRAMCYKTFVNPFITVRGDLEDLLLRPHVHGEDAHYRKYREAIFHALFCPVRVSSAQYGNVGLSLWAAAFVLVQLLAQELKGTTRLLVDQLFPNRDLIEAQADPATPPALREEDKLHLLELGAGVGLTPILLHRMPTYRRYVSSFVLSDYMPELTENMVHNLKHNGVTLVKDLHAAAMGLEGEQRPPFHSVIELDWSKTYCMESMLVDCGCDVVLAADCIYDVAVIPALAQCIHMALTVPLVGRSIERSILAQRRMSNSSLGSFSFARGPSALRLRTPVCIVVQTHRQNSTMKRFFDEVRPFATVKSYSLVRGTLPELRPRLSATLDGEDGGLVPLEDWHLQPDEVLLEHSERIFCALQPDEVLEDGSLRSATQSPPFTTILSAAHSENMSHDSARSDEEPANISAVLHNEMIGPFHVGVTGAIGVHILQCKDARTAPEA